MVGIAMTVAGGAALLFGRRISKAFMDVQDAFANVSTLLDEGQDAMEIFGDEVARLSTSLPVQGGRVEVLNGLYQVLSAGITDTAEASVVLEVALKTARAGMTDTFTAVDVITTALNAYGLSADRAAGVSDILFEAVRRGKLTFDDIAGTIGRTIGIAAQLDIPLTEIAAAMATLTKQGINAEEASTGLTATFVSLLKPSEEMKLRLEELGLESASMALKTHGLSGTIALLTEGLQDDNEALAELFPNVRALRTVMPLAGKAAETFAEDLRAMEEATGAAGVAFAKTADTYSAKMIILKNRMDLAVESIGEDATPAMVTLTGVIARGAEGLAWFNKKTGGVIGALTMYGGAALATIGPLIAMIAQIKIMTIAQAMSNTQRSVGIATLIGQKIALVASTVALFAKTIALKLVTAAQWAWNIAVSANPIGLIILAIAALIIGIILLIRNWDKVVAAMTKVWDFLKRIFIPIFEFLASVPKRIMNAYIELGKFFLKIIVIYLNAWKTFLLFFKDLGIKIVTWIVDGITGIFGRLVDLGKDIMKAIIDGMLNFLKGAGDFFGGIADQIVGFFTGSPQLDPLLARKFERIGEEMSGSIAEGIVSGTSSAENVISHAIGNVRGTFARRTSPVPPGTSISIRIGSIVASSRREGRDAADALMVELKRRGIHIGLGV